MVIETEIKIGSKYRFVSQNIDEVVTITESPVKNSSGFLEYGARNKDGVYRICFNDELFKLETSDSTCTQRFGDWRSKSLPPNLKVSTTLDGFYFANCVLAAVFFSC